MAMNFYNGTSLLFYSSVRWSFTPTHLLNFVLVYALYVFICVFGNWFHRRKFPEKYRRGPDGNILRQRSYFLNDLVPDEALSNGIERPEQKILVNQSKSGSIVKFDQNESATEPRTLRTEILKCFKLYDQKDFQNRKGFFTFAYNELKKNSTSQFHKKSLKWIYWENNIFSDDTILHRWLLDHTSFTDWQWPLQGKMEQTTCNDSSISHPFRCWSLLCNF